MTEIIKNLLNNYKLKSKNEYENAIQEIMQEIALVGLWRAQFFEQAAFYGGTSLRILHGLQRFSEDLDFSLLQPNPLFDLHPFLRAVEEELTVSGLHVNVEHKIKNNQESIRSAFLKAGTLETFIRIELDEPFRKHTHSNEMIKIKLEIDIDPPLGFNTEIRYLTTPIPFSIRTFVPEDLFAGKMHALICRPYKVRVKGRDWYDFVWYIAQGCHLHLSHLEIRMRQSGHYRSSEVLTPEILSDIVTDKITGLNIEAAKEDIRRFIRDPREIDGWSTEFFLSLLPRIKFQE